MSDQTSLAYIRRTYGVPAKMDGRVAFTAFGKRREATIVGGLDGKLKVRFDDGRALREAFALWGVAGVEDLAGSHLAALRGHVLAAGLAVSSQALALAAVRSFLLWAADLGGLRRLTPDQVRRLLKTPRGTSTGLLAILSPEEARRLVAAAADPRDRALVLVMLGGGLRAAEVCDLRGEDLGADAEGAPVLKVRGKGRKGRSSSPGVSLKSCSRSWGTSTPRPSTWKI